MVSDLCSYLAVLLVAALYKVGDATRVLQKGNVIQLMENKFDNFMGNKGAKIYDNYGTLPLSHRLYALPKELVD